MAKPGKVDLKLTIEVTYEADVFEDDPSDVFEIARLEQTALEQALEDAVASVVGEPTYFYSEIKPD